MPATNFPLATWNFRDPESVCYAVMIDFAIDPELRIRVSPPTVLRRTSEAMMFIRQTTPGRVGSAWVEVQQRFEEATDEWSAMEAVVMLEMLLEAEGLLIENTPAPRPSSFSPQDRSRAASSSRA